MNARDRAVRDLTMAAERLCGATCAELAGRHGLSLSRVRRILRRVLDAEARARARHMGGRPRLFADDPARRTTYLGLRAEHGAERARREMGL